MTGRADARRNADNQSKLQNRFKDAFKKMSLLGHDESLLIDCGEVIPIPPPPASNAHFPAGLTHNDVEQAVSASRDVSSRKGAEILCTACV